MSRLVTDNLTLHVGGGLAGEILREQIHASNHALNHASSSTPDNSSLESQQEQLQKIVAQQHTVMYSLQFTVKATIETQQAVEKIAAQTKDLNDKIDKLTMLVTQQQDTIQKLVAAGGGVTRTTSTAQLQQSVLASTHERASLSQAQLEDVKSTQSEASPTSTTQTTSQHEIDTARMSTASASRKSTRLDRVDIDITISEATPSEVTPPPASIADHQSDQSSHDAPALSGPDTLQAKFQPSSASTTQPQSQPQAQLSIFHRMFSQRAKDRLVSRNLIRTKYSCHISRRPTTHKDHVLSELLRTEASYLNTLDILKAVYYDHLPRYGVEKAVVNSLFPHLHALIDIHKKMFESLRRIVADIPPESPSDGPTAKNDITPTNDATNVSDDDDVIVRVADVLKTTAPEFSFYSVFVNSVEQCREKRKELANNPSLASVFMCGAKQAGGKNLETLIIAPVQRVSKYPLMLEELSKDCTTEQQKKAVQSAIIACKTVSEKLNKSKGQTEARELLRVWSLKLGDPQMLSESRFVVGVFKCATVAKYEKNNRFNLLSDDASVVLCNDLIAVASGKELLCKFEPLAQTVVARAVTIRTQGKEQLGYHIRNLVTPNGSVYVFGLTQPKEFVLALRDNGTIVDDPEYPESDFDDDDDDDAFDLGGQLDGLDGECD